MEFEKALVIDQNNLTARYNLAVLLANVKKHQQAIVHLEKVILLNPNDFGARFFLAQQLAKLGRCTEAAALQQKLMARAIEDRNAELQSKLKTNLCQP